MSFHKASFVLRVAAVICCFLLVAVAPHAQQISGSVTGTVKDSQGAVIPGAHVTLLDQDHSSTRKMDSSAEGLFNFDLLEPSTYSVTVEAPGFKKWEKKDILLHGSDHVGVNDILMQVGQVQDTVTVEATAVTLQTENAKVEALVTGQQITELATFNRNFLYFLRTVPGVTNATSGADINGSRADQISFKLDGVSNMDMGNNSCCSTMPNMDMISEIKVVTTAGTADQGTLGASQISVVTRSGSKEFHGSLYFLGRREWLDANSWTNNYNGTPIGRDRQNQGGFTIGGPVFIPKVFNTKKEKLYFFVGEELWKNMTPASITTTVLTALERKGDFSQSIRGNNTVPTITDPNAGNAPFTNNVIPQNRLNQDMLKIAALMPLPTITPAMGYGTQFNYNLKIPTVTPSTYDYLNQSYRIDYNWNDKWRSYFRFSHDNTEQDNARSMGTFEYDANGNTLGRTINPRTTYNIVLNTTTVISPTSTNEFIVGLSKNANRVWVDKATYLRANLGLSYQNPFPSVVRGDYGPRISFSSGTTSQLSNLPSFGTGNPYYAINPDFNVTDNFTKVFARHTFKAGALFTIDRKDQDPWGGTNHAGSFNFSQDAANACDSAFTWSNFVTGCFQTFTQPSVVNVGRFVFKQPEWYVQDTYKIRPNLTIDFGIRWYVMQPQYEAKGNYGTFVSNLWDPSKTVTLYQKVLVSGASKALNPLTGQILPAFMQGAVVTGSGDINNGFVKYGTNGLYSDVMPYNGIKWAPRLGIAWQALPKTVIRVGSGIFYDRIQGNIAFDSQGNIPLITRSSTYQYGYVSDINSSLYNIFTPSADTQGGYTGSGAVPRTINWNFTVEREMPFATLLSVGYVGNIARHMPYLNWLNEPSYGSAWQPYAQDPTANGGVPRYDGTTTLPENFYRPYRGASDIRPYATGGSSNYNSLQVQANKRMSRKLSYQVAYTWSKAMGTNDTMWNYINPFGMRKYHYGRLAFDHTQNLSANFVYYLPKFGKNGNLLDHRGVRLAFNDWQLSGFLNAVTGTPANFGFPSFQTTPLGWNTNQVFTGQANWGPRPVIGNWKIPSSQMSDYVQFNTLAITQAQVHNSVGLESGQNDTWSNPLTFLSSPEIVMAKNIVFSKDGRRYLSLRLETYNALNHHDWTGRGMSPQYNCVMGYTYQASYSCTSQYLTNLPLGISTVTNSTGGIVSGGRFGYGALSGAASPRRVQLQLRLYF